MSKFKLQHPSDLISRLFIAEYMRDLTAPLMYNRANKYQKEQLFYKFTEEESDLEQVDFNWEFIIFGATLHQLESFLKNFMDEIEEIEKKRNEGLEKLKQEMFEERVAQPVDINIMDLAATEMRKNNGVQL